MNKLIIILLFICSLSYSQIDSLDFNELYVKSENHAERINDSIDKWNGYPRGDAERFQDVYYDSIYIGYRLSMNRVSEKYLKVLILDSFEFPTMRVPLSELTTTIKELLWSEIQSEGWYVYLKNSNFWMFNYNTSADDEFSQAQIDWVINHGGALWNFE